MTAGDAKTLVIGCGYTLITALHGSLPPASVVVVEEPALIERQRGGLRERAARLPVVDRLVGAEYVDRLDPRALLDRLPHGTSISRVVPGTDEMSAVASAAVAEELGLPGAGVRAAGILADKLELRATADAAGLRGPRWHEVCCLDDVETAAARLGTEIVLKPATRSGSTGVLLLDRGDDLREAWLETRSAGASGGARSARFLVEERMRGPEVSVECLVAAGDVVFANVTAKRVATGRHPVEIGHALPAAVDPAVDKELRECMQALVTAVGFGYGVLHGEWILGPAGPLLVECAGRIPGDEITHLLSLAYGVDFIAGYADILTGSRPAADDARRWTATQAAAVRFLTPPAGTVEEVTGVGDAAALPWLLDIEVEASPGAEVAELRASSDRAGFVVTVGADAAEAAARAEAAAARIVVRTAP